MSFLCGLTAAEVFNSVSGPPLNALWQDASSLLDMAAANGTVFPLVAADDSHAYTGEQFGGYIMLQAPALTREAVLDALDAGRFYASQGPRFEQISLENGVLRLRCSPVSRIIFYSNQAWAFDRCVEGDGLTQAQYDTTIQAKETFLRVQIIDAQGRSAWSSPIRP